MMSKARAKWSRFWRRNPKQSGIFWKGLRGTIHVTFEEGTQPAWLYEMVKPVVAEGIVGNFGRNKLLAVGNKADRVVAQNLAELLRCGQLKPFYPLEC